MIKDYETKLLKLNTPLRGHNAGVTVRVKARNGVLLDQYWRRRLQDAAIDNCVEIIQPRKENHKKTINTKTED